MDSAAFINSVILICVMLMLSAFFSGMEIAFLSKNRLREEIDRKQSPMFDFIALPQVATGLFSNLLYLK